MFKNLIKNKWASNKSIYSNHLAVRKSGFLTAEKSDFCL